MNELSHICGSERYEACADDSAGMQGSPFQRALPAGELSADSRGSAPPGALDRYRGKMLPASPSESATASFDGRRLSKVLLRYFRRK